MYVGIVSQRKRQRIQRASHCLQGFSFYKETRNIKSCDINPMCVLLKTD